MSQEYPPPPPATSRVRFVLLATWGGLTAAAVGFVLTFGTNCPSADEWAFVPVLTGHEPAGPWLWAQHNEHRLPLSRVVYLALFRLTHDYRAGMLLQVVVLSGLSLWLMRVAARLRGKPAWPDVFFPVALLHAGHWENLLMGYQLCFTLFTAFTTLLGVVALRTTPETAFRSGVAAGVLALLLCLTVGAGVVVALPVAAWLLYLAVAMWRCGAMRRAAVLVALAALPPVYLALYFQTFTHPAHHPPPSAAGEPTLVVVQVAGQALAMAFGIGLHGSWAVLAVGLLALGGFTLVAVVRQLKPPAAVGLIAVAAGVAGVAMAVGVGRAGLGLKAGLAARYALLTWPLLGLAYLFWARCGGRAGRWVPVGLCVVAAAAFPPNTGGGLGPATHSRAVLGAVEAAAAAGEPPEQVVRHFGTSYQSGHEPWAVRAIPMLREAGVGAFAGSPPTPWWMAGGVAVLVLGGFAVRWASHLGRAVQVERARELFRLQHERFEQMLIAAATATGKPRGLTWAGCEIVGDAVLARDGTTRGIVALVPVVIHFEPVPGSDMADVPAAKEPRRATAVFTFLRGHWHTDGRVVFNLDPRQAAAHFGKNLTVIEGHP